jgi:hypothetical protein
MIKCNIEVAASEWDFKSQRYWEINIWDLIAKIETWAYRSKTINYNIENLDVSWYKITINDLFDFMLHIKIVNNANLKYPIILSRKWEIIDGRHRVVKAILEWKKTIKAVMVLEDII